MLQATRIWIEGGRAVSGGQGAPVAVSVNSDTVLFIEDRPYGSRIYFDTQSKVHFIDAKETKSELDRRFMADRC